jgi:putative transposase
METIYFITLCIEDRKPVLANDLAWSAILAAFKKSYSWHFFSAVAMPDHLHFLAAPQERSAKVGTLSRWLKYHVTQRLKPDWSWQEGCFDRLLRTTESWEEKWFYVRQNPVRAGLVLKPEDWPHRLDPPGIGFLL